VQDLVPDRVSLMMIGRLAMTRSGRHPIRGQALLAAEQ
jgi:hypothetical protein